MAWSDWTVKPSCCPVLLEYSGHSARRAGLSDSESVRRGRISVRSRSHPVVRGPGTVSNGAWSGAFDPPGMYSVELDARDTRGEGGKSMARRSFTALVRGNIPPFSRRHTLPLNAPHLHLAFGEKMLSMLTVLLSSYKNHQHLPFTRQLAPPAVHCRSLIHTITLSESMFRPSIHAE